MTATASYLLNDDVEWKWLRIRLKGISTVLRLRPTKLPLWSSSNREELRIALYLSSRRRFVILQVIAISVIVTGHIDYASCLLDSLTQILRLYRFSYWINHCLIVRLDRIVLQRSILSWLCKEWCTCIAWNILRVKHGIVMVGIVVCRRHLV